MRPAACMHQAAAPHQVSMTLAPAGPCLALQLFIQHVKCICSTLPGHWQHCACPQCHSCSPATVLPVARLRA